jgi:FkbM family methyltransferase
MTNMRAQQQDLQQQQGLPPSLEAVFDAAECLPVFIDAPAQIPPGISYRIYGEGERSQLLREILSFALPDAKFIGFCSAIEGAASSDAPEWTIIVDPDYPKILAETPSHYLPRVIILPIQEGDPWGYWDIVGRNKNLITKDKQGGHLPVTHLLQLLAAERPWLYAFDKEKNAFNINLGVFVSSEKDFIAANKNKISYVCDRLSDQESVDTYYNVMYGDYTIYFRRFFNNIFKRIQYCDHIKLKPGDLVINGGLHSGYELPFFLNKLKGRGKIHNIDPMGEQFLSSYTKTYLDNFREMVVTHDVALAVYDGTLDMRVDPDGQAIREGRGEILKSFPCQTFRSLIKQAGIEKIDFLKLDLEGAEIVILQDIVAVAKQYRPQIAISIYHHTIDFVEIPYVLMSTLTEYDFYIAAYGYERWEVLLYCIPLERRSPRSAGLQVSLPVQTA